MQQPVATSLPFVYMVPVKPKTDLFSVSYYFFFFFYFCIIAILISFLNDTNSGYILCIKQHAVVCDSDYLGVSFLFSVQHVVLCDSHLLTTRLQCSGIGPGLAKNLPLLEHFSFCIQ